MIDKIVRAIGGNHKLVGGWYKFEKCPYCKSVGKGDNYTFAVNAEKGTFKCHRGNTCGVSGGIRKLAKDFNVDIGNNKFKNIQVVKKNYSSPNEKVETPTDKMYKYFEKRGISKKIVDFAQVKAVNKKTSEIVFDYYDENNVLTFRKFKTGKKGFRREKDTKDIFYMMNHIKDFNRLIITEGEEDCLSLWECGIEAVSISSGATNMECVTNCFDWLEQFETIIIWTDNDKAGNDSQNEISKRLGMHRCKEVSCGEYKDANDVLKYAGKDEIKRIIDTAEYIPISDVVDLATIDIFQIEKVEKVESCFRYINKNTHGGYKHGDVILWTGYASSGKSTMLSQEIVNFLEQDHSVCMYSSEYVNKEIVKTIYKQMCGEGFLKHHHDIKYNNDYYNLTMENVQAMAEHIYGRLFSIEDRFDGDATDIFKTFESIYMRYGVKIFTIDNMATLLPYNQNSLNDTQTRFIKEAEKFVKKFNVTLHIVAHQKNAEDRQTKQDKKKTLIPTLYGIMGTSNLPNLADVVIGVIRVEGDDVHKAATRLLKERETGKVGGYELMKFNKNDEKYNEGHEIHFKKWKKYLVE